MDRTYALYKFIILCIDENTSFQALINYALINSDRLKRVEKSRFNAGNTYYTFGISCQCVSPNGAIILLIFRHGLRTAELVALKWSQIDLVGGYIEIDRVKHGHDRIHPLRSPELRAKRQIYRDYPDTNYVFVSERKAPLSTRLIRHIIARAGKLAEIPFEVHPHQLPESLWLLFSIPWSQYQSNSRLLRTQEYTPHNTLYPNVTSQI